MIKNAHTTFIPTINDLAIATTSSYSSVCSSEKEPIAYFHIVHNFFIVDSSSHILGLFQPLYPRSLFIPVASIHI